MAEDSDEYLKISRRTLLQGAVCAACAAPLLVVTTNAAMAAKMPKTAAGYKNSPNGDKSCGVCKHFQPPSACALVDGDINANGYCNLWVKK